jgi:hypothetical protein
MLRLWKFRFARLKLRISSICDNARGTQCHSCFSSQTTTQSTNETKRSILAASVTHILIFRKTSGLGITPL